MKPAVARLAAIVVVVIVAAAGWWLWSFHRSGPSTFSGYVDADYVWVASPLAGTLTVLDVRRGDKVHKGQRVFVLDDIAERAARNEAEGRLDQAEAQLADLLTGRRPAEIDTIAAQLAQAQAALRQSEADYRRQVRLKPSGGTSAQQMEQSRSLRDQNRGRTEELEAQLRVARLPGRDEQINAAKATADAAKAALAQAQWRLDQKTGLAPTESLVVDTLYRPGEMVNAGAPVVQLLPPENIKIRFFVPETMVAQLSVGEPIRVSCDGCGAPVPSVIRFISPQAEFTPPVIYSREQRARLVFMVEARPTEHPERLRIGQPVDVTMASP